MLCSLLPAHTFKGKYNSIQLPCYLHTDFLKNEWAGMTTATCLTAKTHLNVFIARYLFSLYALTIFW